MGAEFDIFRLVKEPEKQELIKVSHTTLHPLVSILINGEDNKTNIKETRIKRKNLDPLKKGSMKIG